jgi:carboxymethylenebutenolidase
MAVIAKRAGNGLVMGQGWRGPCGPQRSSIRLARAGETPLVKTEIWMAVQSNIPSDIIGLTKATPVTRRGFMSASAASAAGYTLAAGPVRAQAITTDTSGLTEGDAKIAVSGGDMPVYFARPANVQNPPVILVAMEIFGLHTYIKDVVRRLAKLGAFAVAPDYYFRKGVDLTKITEIPQLLPIVNTKPDEELLADLDATVAWAKSQGGDTNRLGIIGYCRGGRTVWIYAAHNPNLKAAASFYGPVVDPPAQKAIWSKSATELAPDMKAPVLGLYGEADQGIPVATVDAMKAALQAAGKKAEFKIYPGAPHGFHADYRPTYRKEAAEDAWSQVVAWFKANRVLPEHT